MSWAEDVRANQARVLDQVLPDVQARLDRVDPVLTANQAINVATIRDRAATALTTNAAFLALASPTNAQVLAQTKALTRECSALIRLTLNMLDSISDT